MAVPPSRTAVLALYASTLRAARAFGSYNFRYYFVRRTRDNFRSMQGVSDPLEITRAYNEAVDQLAMLRRSAVVNQLYGRSRLPVERETAVPSSR